MYIANLGQFSGSGEPNFLYRNDLAGDNNWLKVRARGTSSNRAAIGAKVRAKATIAGAEVWQLREISAQNTVNGHNSLIVHFGLGDATQVDSLRIEWPSGLVETMTAVAANQLLEIEEGPLTSVNGPQVQPPAGYLLEQNYPNPFNPATTIHYELPAGSQVTLTVYDLQSRPIAVLVDQWQAAGRHRISWNGRDGHDQRAASGLYFYRLKSGSLVLQRRMLLLK